FEDFTVFIPRPLLYWGTTMAVILSPDWEVEDCGQYICNSGGYFGAPKDDGRLGSGTINNIASPTELRTCTFISGSEGRSNWVGGVGVIDGVNQTFRLIQWDGTGEVGARLNGLGVEIATTDTTALTATLTEAPTYGDVLLF